MDAAATPGLTLHSRTGVADRFDPGARGLELLTTGGPVPTAGSRYCTGPPTWPPGPERSRLTPTPDLQISDAEVADPRRLRDAPFRAAIARTRSEPPAPRDLTVINQAAAHPSLAPTIGSAGNR
jgi:hypothetical protein